MQNLPDTNQSTMSNPSRRTLMQSAKWIIGGVALAGLGLGLAPTGSASAAGMSQFSAQIPNCEQCNAGACDFISCTANDPSCNGNSNGSFRVRFTITEAGCFVPGVGCPTNHQSYCARSCCQSVPSGCGCP